MKTKRIVSLLLALVLLLGILPFSAFAEEKGEAIPEAEATAAAELPQEETPGEEEATAPTSTEAEASTTVEETLPPEETTEPMPEPDTEPVEEPVDATEAVTEPAQETEGAVPPEASATEPEETEIPVTEPEAAPMKAQSRASTNGLYTWQDHVLNQDKYYTFPNGGHVYGLPRLDYNGTPAFCIEPGVTAQNGVNTVRNQTYAIQRLGGGQIGGDKYKAITLAMAYGWPNTEYATSNTGYVSHFTGTDNTTYREMEKYAATQIIIWEIALGYRSYNAPYTVTDISLFNRYYTTTWGEHWDNLKSVYDQITAKMAQHNKIPSFTSDSRVSNPTYKLDYNAATGMYTKTLTDTKGVLSGFRVTSSIPGVSFSKSGNSLTITATPAGAQALQKGATCTLQNDSLLSVDPETSALVYGNAGSQTVILPGRYDPARAYFKLEADTNIAKVVKQNSEAGGRIANFTFELRDSAGTVLDTKVTDANGNLAFSTALTVGATYVIHEVPANGFVVQLDQEFTAQRGENVVTFVNTKVYGNVQVVKVDQETGDRLTGAVFQIYQDSNGNGVLDDVDLPSAATMKTDGENPGVYYFNHLPYGKYHLREVQAPEGYYLDDTVYNFEIVEDGKTVIVESATGTGTIANKPMIPEIGTTATVDGSHKIYGTEIFTLKDVVAYKNLIPRKTYTVSGVLMDKATGEPLLIDGEEVTSKTTFVPEESSGTVTVSFQFDSRKIKTETEIVVFESLLLNGKEVAVHANINDQGQTVKVTPPEIGTTAMVDGSHEIYGTEIFTLEDVVAYSNLTPGKEYVLQGVLMDKATGSPLLIDGKGVTAETTFVPEESSGTVTVSFQFDSRKIKTETEIVAFESLKREGVEIAVHADLEDVGQTVTVYVPEIGTTATVDGSHVAYGADVLTLEDVVAYKNLTPGKEYSISGVLMDKATGSPLLIDGEEVTAETTFVPEESSGEVTVSFQFDGRGIKQETEIVAFESLQREGVEIAVHADLEDGGQTVTVTPPEIHTTATVDGGKKAITAGKPITVMDVVSYKGLIPGKEYTVKGILMNKATGTSYLVDGKEITAEASFVAETKDGEVKMFFMFDTKGITKTTELVAFETVYREGVEVGVHADINDEGQTVTITPPVAPPNTGDNSNLVLWASILTLALLSLTGIAVFALRKKQR